MSTNDEPDREGTPVPPSEIVGTINIPILARICDDIRASIISYRSPGAWPHLTELYGLISAFLADEDVPKMHISLDTIRACRLDKLLEDILEPEYHPHGGEGDDEFTGLVSKACKLQRTWRARFKEAYDELDEVRCREMLTIGRLQGLRFCVDDQPRWVLKKGAEEPLSASMEPGT